MDLKFFKTPADLRKWFEKNHDKEAELWVGFYKKDSGKPSITWPESVDEALCFGWIDGIRKSVDEVSYKIRFTPRRAQSVWSAVNIKRVAELSEQKRMRPTGEKAFGARMENRSGIYAYEQRKPELPAPYEKKMRKNKAAWEFFHSQPPSYRKLATWWVVSARKDETRLKRLEKLIEESANNRRV
ncbi:MAG: YdeI/OmpD-associated family protein [Acidobacteriota bacterium]